MSNEIKTRIELLRKLIEYHNDLYFQQQQPEIEDSEYDQLYEELKSLEQQYPEHDDSNSPTHKVGGKAENTFIEVEHKIPMLSLDKSMSWEEAKKWIITMIKFGVKEFTIELKYDGLACSLRYENGKFTVGATRGDGRIGDDITATALMVSNIPRTVKEQLMMEVRGEILLLKTGLEQINLVKTLRGEKTYLNVRNAASGILRAKNPDKSFCQYLRFAPYMLAQKDVKNTSHMDDMNYLLSENFVFMHPFTVKLFSLNNYSNADEMIESIKKYFEKVEECRPALDFDVDGLVIKANLYTEQNKLGSKSNVPNWATAYKFPAMAKMSQLLDVEWLLGAKGNITPRAKITPIEIGGTTITKPTLHNIEELKRLGIKIGDYIMVERRGDVIPKVVKVLTELRTGNEKDIVIPTTCPECGKPITFDKAFIRCDDPDCSGRQSSRIENFIRSLEIEEFGPKIIEKLIDSGKLNDVADIYSLVVNDISSLERMGQRSATKIINNISKSQNAPLDKVIAGLTIKNVSYSTGRDLASKYQTLDAFARAKYDELSSMDGLGPVTSQYIINWLENIDNQGLINKLIALGIGQNPIEEVQLSSTKLNNMKFSFTGKVSIPRTQIEQLITENGGEVFGLKKGLQFLIIGDGAKQHKIDKAGELGSQVISEEEFRNMIKGE